MNNLISKILIWFINLYRRYISPHTRPCCRFYPSCSKYAILAIQKYGPFRGVLMAVWRILRCNPFSGGGIDFP